MPLIARDAVSTDTRLEGVTAGGGGEKKPNATKNKNWHRFGQRRRLRRRGSRETGKRNQPISPFSSVSVKNRPARLALAPISPIPLPRRRCTRRGLRAAASMSSVERGRSRRRGDGGGSSARNAAHSAAPTVGHQGP
jgi:hypothetical protein